MYLTGPYDGAPFGLSIVVPATESRALRLRHIVTQAGISIDPYTARVTVAGEVPTIVGGVPLRLKALKIAIERGNFMLNPTNCEALSTNTTLTSTLGGTSAMISTPFQATGCISLAFKPKFSYSTNANTTKRFGASLNVKVSEPAGNANLKSVRVTLPMKLPSRTSTLAKSMPGKDLCCQSRKLRRRLAGGDREDHDADAAWHAGRGSPTLSRTEARRSPTWIWWSRETA